MKHYNRDSKGKFVSFVNETNSKIIKVLKFITLCLVVYGAVRSGISYESKYGTPKIVEAQVIREVVSTSTPPILLKIIKCESGGKHMDGNGQVLMRSNVNKTVDLGIAQINSVWFATATKMGYDLTKETDNLAFARYLFFTYGDQPWYSSSVCWQH